MFHRQFSVKKRVIAVTMAAVLVVLAVVALRMQNRPEDVSGRATLSPDIVSPPWVYGRLDAQFVLTGYYDVLCPVCGEHFPLLREWISNHPDVSLEWHHRPLSIHDPGATAAAKLLECIGREHGNAAFWGAAAIAFERAGNVADSPTMTAAVHDCVASPDTDAAIKRQIESAELAGITATPTFRLSNRLTGQSVLLLGAVEGDSILSAVGLLIADQSDGRAGNNVVESRF